MNNMRKPLTCLPKDELEHLIDCAKKLDAFYQCFEIVKVHEDAVQAALQMDTSKLFELAKDYAEQQEDVVIKGMYVPEKKETRVTETLGEFFADYVLTTRRTGEYSKEAMEAAKKYNDKARELNEQ